VPRTGALDGLWVATAALAALPLAVSVAGPGPLTAGDRAAALLVVLLAAWRPLDAVLVIVALAPLGGAVRALIGAIASPAESMVAALLLGLAVAGLRRRLTLRDASPWLTAAALALAWLALASVAAQVLRDQVWYETPTAWLADATRFLSGDFFVGRSRWRTAADGAIFAQQVLLVPAVAAVARGPGGAARLATMLAAGATATAAQNVLRVVEIALRTGDASASLGAIARTIRVSAAFPDANAAGSYFALAVIVSAALLWQAAIERRRIGAAGWTLSLLLIGTALYLTGSRVALAVAPPVAGFTVLATRRVRPLTRRGFAVAAVVVTMTIALVATAQARRAVNDASKAVHIRAEFVRTTWRMLADRPVFGVGAGAYRQASGRYSSDALKRYYPTQNAHNNFLQVAGELGPLGLAALIVLVAVPMRQGWGAVRRQPGPVAAGLLGGVVAFLLTCLGGHPLLIPAVAATFMVAIGALAAVDAPVRREPRGRWTMWLIVLGAVLAVSVPVRARAERSGLDLEHAILGRARWQLQPDGTTAATFRGSLAFYVRAGGQRLTLELRPARRHRRPVDVTLQLDGRPINVIRLHRPDWHSVAVVVPRVSGRPFRVLRLETGHPGAVATRAPAVRLRRPQSPR
jgi:O-antigen ligase